MQHKWGAVGKYAITLLFFTYLVLLRIQIELSFLTISLHFIVVYGFHFIAGII